MARSHDVLIPARFLLTLGHFVTVVLAFFQIDINVAAGLSSSASPDAFAAARRSLSAALGISIVAFVVQFGGLLSGATLFRDRLNLFHTVLHFFGGVLTAWFVVDGWGYLSYWSIMVPFNLLPGVVEAVVLSSALGSIGSGLRRKATT